MKTRVLVVEACPGVRGRLIDLLEAAGLSVRTAASATSLRAAVREGWAQLVVIGPGARGKPVCADAVCSAVDMPTVVLPKGAAPAAEVASAIAELARQFSPGVEGGRADRR